MKGRRILVEPLASGGHAAALMIDGRLHDLLIDPPSADARPVPEAIYRAVPTRPMKGLGGAMVDLGGGETGFLRGPHLPPPGRPLLVQVTGWAEPGKAPPVSARLLLKGRAAILTPGAPGINLARALRDPERRDALAALASTAARGRDPGVGLIVRSAAATSEDTAIGTEIAALLQLWDDLDRQVQGSPARLHPAPGAAALARREWQDGATPVREASTALADAGIWEEVEGLRHPEVSLGSGLMVIEPTRALVAVDVNTGADVSPAAGLKANLAAAAELPRQLRLRGLGGQIAVDFAPMPRVERVRVEHTLAVALKADDTETAMLGWTPLGHLELQRKRARRPL